MHKLLKRQLAELIPEGERLPEYLQPLLAEIDSVYEQAEKDHKELEALLQKDTHGGNVKNKKPTSQPTDQTLHTRLNILQKLFDSSPDAIIVADQDGVIQQVNRQVETLFGYAAEALVGQPIELLLPKRFRERHPAHRRYFMDKPHPRPMGIGMELAGLRKDGTEFPVEVNLGTVESEAGSYFLSTIRDISERKGAEAELKRRLADFEAVNRLSTALRRAQTVDQMLPIVLDVTLEILQATRGSVWLYDPSRDELRPVVQRGQEQTSASAVQPERPGEGIAGYVFSLREPYSTKNFALDPHMPEVTRSLLPADVGGTVAPIRAGDTVIGVIVISVRAPRELTPDEVNLLMTLGEISGNAIQRTRLFQQTAARLEHIAALHAIDKVISSSFNLQLTLGVVLSQVIDQLGVDAADVLLLDPQSNLLDFGAGQGFRSSLAHRTPSWLDDSQAARVVSERRMISMPNFNESGNPFLDDRSLQNEGFMAYFGTPLISKGQVKGVLEVFHRRALNPDPEWLEFFETLAGQAVIAVDNAALFDGLQRSNLELTLAYDATIEGWSRALDLRDRETEGHTQRVTEMTMRLARATGMKDADLVQIRRGALLHDIGKMGVPDNILLKPDKLTAEEWTIMRKHPSYAYEMLSPIRFLHPALEIPYCHHEKWDGSGYPRGLHGEQIPLAARLFAVVDIWDALRSDRPYRQAWSEDKVREFILSLAGNHLDPQAVEVFMTLDKENRSKTA